MSDKFRASYGNGPRISREFTASSGSLASGAESAQITLAHGLGFTPPSIVVAGHLEDGSWSHQVGWRFVGFDGTNVAFRFLNHGPNTATAILRFRLIY